MKRITYILLLSLIAGGLYAQDISLVGRSAGNSRDRFRINQTINQVNNTVDSTAAQRAAINLNTANIALGVDTSAAQRVDINTNTTAIAALDLREETYHAFVFFGDSAVSKSYTTSWAQLTNAIDSMFIQYELDGFTMSGDTITCTTGGDYVFHGQFTHDGDNGETISIRFFNVTQTAGIPTAGANTTRAANNFMGTFVLGYYDITAGDKIVMQYKGDASGTAVFKNASVLIEKIHE